MIQPGEVYMADFGPAGPMGVLDDAALGNVIKAIGYVIKSDCKPL